ncbi:ABC transporter permease [Actinoplanes sp. NPDC020271]|uniref:ABC transporter permease n=1 Tax=Actinoplanes sp. NPDC020271 TaxID=3363896 RepID=UPI0037981039
MIGPLSRIAALARLNAVLRLRDPGQFLSYLLMPMLGMIALKPLYLRAMPGGTTQVATGLLVMFSALALHIVGAAILTERGWHTWDRLRATRATTAELLLGKAIPVYAVLLLQQAILATFGVLVVGLRATWLLPVAVAAWGVTLLAIGSALAAVVRSHGELHAICDIGALVVTTIGGALVPVALFPPWLQAVAPFSPGYWALTMLQSAARGDAPSTLTSAALLLAVALVAGTFACRRLSRGWTRATLL